MQALYNFLNTTPLIDVLSTMKKLQVGVKKIGDLYLFNYEDEAPRGHPIVDGCRGTIWRYHEGEKWICIRSAMDRFFNLNEVVDVVPFTGVSDEFSAFPAQNGSIDTSVQPTSPLLVHEKLDGTLALLYWNVTTKTWTVGTRNSFDCSEIGIRGNLNMKKVFDLALTSNLVKSSPDALHAATSAPTTTQAPATTTEAPATTSTPLPTSTPTFSCASPDGTSAAASAASTASTASAASAVLAASAASAASSESRSHKTLELPDELKTYTFLFELCSPYNQVVVYHTKPSVTLLSVRSNVYPFPELDPKAFLSFFPGAKLPETFEFANVDACRDYVEKRGGENFEGMVLVQGPVEAPRRLKLKSKAFVTLAYTGSIKALPEEQILAALLKGSNELAELLSYYPIWTDKADKIAKMLLSFECLLAESQKAIDDLGKEATRAQIAKIATSSVCPNYFFAVLSKKAKNLDDYIKGQDIASLLTMIGYSN
jgi:hypothetical protein